MASNSLNFKEKHKMLWYKLLQNTTYCVKLRVTSYPIYGLPMRRWGLNRTRTEGGQVWIKRLSP
jgi:hypothetical protein